MTKPNRVGNKRAICVDVLDERQELICYDPVAGLPRAKQRAKEMVKEHPEARFVQFRFHASEFMEVEKDD